MTASVKPTAKALISPTPRRHCISFLSESVTQQVNVWDFPDFKTDVINQHYMSTPPCNLGG